MRKLCDNTATIIYRVIVEAWNKNSEVSIIATVKSVLTQLNLKAISIRRWIHVSIAVINWSSSMKHSSVRFSPFISTVCELCNISPLIIHRTTYTIALWAVSCKKFDVRIKTFLRMQSYSSRSSAHQHSRNVQYVRELVYVLYARLPYSLIF